MFYVWLNWHIWLQPTRNDADQSYILNQQTLDTLRGDIDGNGIGLACIIEVLMDEE